MIDITSKIDDAMALRGGWTRERVHQALSLLVRLYPEGVVDWDEGDEQWGRIIARGEARAYVSARCPLAFVWDESEEVVQGVSSRLGIIVMSVRDFDAPSISVDPAALSRLTRKPLPGVVSYGRASVNDIWWATV